MKGLIGAVAAVVAVAACTSETTGATGPNCADITGNWEVTSTKTGGDCAGDPAEGGSSTNVTIRKDGAGYVVVLPAVAGGCPGELSAQCKLISNCDVTGKDGKLAASFGIEWTFNGNSFTGSEVGRLFPPVVQTACEGQYADTGKKL